MTDEIGHTTTAATVGETSTPTAALRWFTDAAHKPPVLQQMFWVGNRQVWRDIPLHYAPGTKSGTVPPVRGAIVWKEPTKSACFDWE